MQNIFFKKFWLQGQSICSSPSKTVSCKEFDMLWVTTQKNPKWHDQNKTNSTYCFAFELPGSPCYGLVDSEFGSQNFILSRSKPLSWQNTTLLMYRQPTLCSIGGLVCYQLTFPIELKSSFMLLDHVKTGHLSLCSWLWCPQKSPYPQSLILAGNYAFMDFPWKKGSVPPWSFPNPCRDRIIILSLGGHLFLFGLWGGSFDSKTSFFVT